MINKKILFNIYISILSICILTLIILALLGKINRIGYLSDLQLNIDKTLALNNFNVYNTKKLFIIDNKLDTDSLINYLFTNENITNYSYGFRVKYHSQIFRNSDIYGVYIDTNKILQENNFIKEIKMNDDKGTPFGNLISSKKLTDSEKIDNVNYHLKVKYKVYIYVLTIMLILFIIPFYKKIILFVNKKNIIKKIILLYSIILILYVILIFVLIFYSNKEHAASISNFELLYETSEGFVYKSNIYPNNNSFLMDKFYRYSDEPLILDNIPTEIKSYGYSIDIDNANEYNKDVWNIGAIYNRYNLYTSKNEEYSIELLAKKISNSNSENIYYFLDKINMRGIITNINISTNYILYSSTNKMETSFDDDNIYNPLTFIFTKGELDIKNIKIREVSQKLYVKNNNYCIITFKNVIPFDYQIENIKYTIKINYKIYLILFVLLIFYIVLAYFYKKDLVNKYITDKMYVIFIVLIGLFIGIFQFWLGFPGSNIEDQIYLLSESLNGVYYNLNPMFIPALLNFLYKIFGYHTFYMFFINIFSFDIGIMLIIIALYLKFRNKIFIFLYLINFSIIKNIFTTNFITYKDFVMGRLVFLLYSIIFFQLLVKIKNKYINILLKIITAIIFLFALLWRHNAIVTLYPIFILFSYILISKISNVKILKKIICFVSIMLFSAIVLVLILKIHPFIYSNNITAKHAANHIFLIQISARAVRIRLPRIQIPESEAAGIHRYLHRRA